MLALINVENAVKGDSRAVRMHRAIPEVLQPMEGPGAPGAGRTRMEGLGIECLQPWHLVRSGMGARVKQPVHKQKSDGPSPSPSSHLENRLSHEIGILSLYPFGTLA